VRHRVGWLLFVTLAGCGGAPATGQLPADPCSELARSIYGWQGKEGDACGPGPTEERELLPLGDGYVLEWVPTTGRERVWSFNGDHPFGPGPINTGVSNVNQGQGLYAIADRRVLAPDLLDTGWRLFAVAVDAQNGTTENAIDGIVHRDVFSDPFWGYELVALDDDYLLKWWSGSGEYTVLHYDRDEETLSTTTFRGTQEALRRGAQLVNLGGNRLLEWIPATGTYRIWQYHLDADRQEIFDPDPVYPEAQLAGVGPRDRILVIDRTPKAERLLVWRRDDGHLSLRTFDPGWQDPLGGDLIAEASYVSLASSDWSAPTESRIKNVVLVLQRGRSFDSYFGRYCTAGPKPDCEQGPGCCEAMPDTTLGAPSPAPLDPDVDDHTPDDRTACLVAKMNAGAMDGYATAAACGSPLDFASAGTGSEAGAIADYHRLADGGALADHFFQTTIDGDQLSAELNLIYLSKAAYGTAVSNEGGLSQLTFLLSEAGVRYALYLDDPQNVTHRYGQLPPEFYDPHWTAFRSIDELDRDIELRQLPAISIVISPPALDEQPGHGPAANGVAFVTRLADQIAASNRYQPSTLMLVGYLTSGGYYDHVTPPPAPPVEVDATGNGRQIPYGPRVPLLALGHFARPGHVSHVPLEISSITAFLEWNWLEGMVGQLQHRDAVVANLGSLLDPAETGVAVPATGGQDGGAP
jgi:hypothetical protein